jgi:uncharacterized Zn-finger protein
MEISGYASKNKLKKHLLKYHDMDTFNDIDFPDPPKQRAPSAAKTAAAFQCPQCNKRLTRNHNLWAHLRSYTGLKPYICSAFEERFTRKP